MQQFGSREALAHHKADAHRRVQMAARDVADSISHGQNGEAESQSHAGESNADCRKRRS
jgi:hypothetical protein